MEDLRTPGVAPTLRPARPVIPERYGVREKEGVRFLECDEAPRLRAVIDPQMSVSRAEAALLGERVILLDGAGSFGPLIDNEHKLYNLDHHAGCERLFTLSTCEQALLMVHSGLDLSEGDWTLYANEPDLDTALALWCLLNHRRVRELRPEARDFLLPLFRLEGAIDANGPDLAQLCGLPTAQLEQTRAHIDDLLARERALKRGGSWAAKDVYAYTIELLRTIDAMVYEDEDFGDYTRVDEIHGYVEIAPRQVAVACRDGAGIYTVEQHLKSRWGDQLSLIALENEPGHYTLRRVSSVVGPELEPVYELLNRVDPAVDGRPPGKRWGGSQDIGGSPRSQGTRLTPEEVLEVMARAHRPSSGWTRARRAGAAGLLGLCFLLLWPLASFVGSLLTLPPGVSGAYRVALAALLALGIGIVATHAASRARLWVFGWRVPANAGGLAAWPLALLGALPIAVLTLAESLAGAVEIGAAFIAGALGLAALEVWFRGLVHGLLVLEGPLQRPGGPWRLSRAAVVSATSYALVVTALVSGAPGLDTWIGPLAGAVGIGPSERLAGIAILAAATGLGLASLRERSLSLAPGLAVQLGGLAAIALGWAAYS